MTWTGYTFQINRKFKIKYNVYPELIPIMTDFGATFDIKGSLKTLSYEICKMRNRNELQEMDHLRKLKKRARDVHLLREYLIWLQYGKIKNPNNISGFRNVEHIAINIPGHTRQKGEAFAREMADARWEMVRARRDESSSHH